MLNGLNIYMESVQQLINILLHFCQNGFFSKEHKILIKNYDSWKVTLLPVFLENSEPKTGQEHKFIQFWNELLYQLTILLIKPYFGLLCAITSFESLLETYNYSVV